VQAQVKDYQIAVMTEDMRAALTLPRPCGQRTHPPRVAFVMAGRLSVSAPSSPRLFESYARHVVASFDANHTLSRVFLLLKVPGAPPDRSSQLPSNSFNTSLGTTLDSLARALPHAEVHLRSEEDDPTFPPSLTELDCLCFRPSKWPLAGRWWGSMRDAWSLVTAYELRKGLRFEMVVFSRPDILYSSPMGPWCEYDVSHTWFTGGVQYTPDMFWVMSRALAAMVLGETLHTAEKCTLDQPCCCSPSANRPLAMGDRVGVSYWPMRYWTMQFNVSISTQIAGHGIVVNHRNKACDNCYNWRPGSAMVLPVGLGN